MNFEIRLAVPGDRPQLLAIWERSVRATHTFLASNEIADLKPLVAAELASDEYSWWVLREEGVAVGFLATGRDSVEGLFIDPSAQGRGGGRLLIAHALAQCKGPRVTVDVNEDNTAALEFYSKAGFVVVGRSATDAGSRAFPVLHLEHSRPQDR